MDYAINKQNLTGLLLAGSLMVFPSGADSGGSFPDAPMATPVITSARPPVFFGSSGLQDPPSPRCREPAAPAGWQ